MTTIIILALLAALTFLFFLYSIYMLAVKKNKSYTASLVASLVILLSTCFFLGYTIITKTYEKITSGADNIIVNSASKTGDIAGKSVTAFEKSAFDGAEEILANEIVVNPELTKKGIEVGKIMVTEDNVLQVYFIFNKDFEGDISIKIKDARLIENGRSKNTITAKSGEADYKAFTFNEFTRIENQSIIYID